MRYVMIMMALALGAAFMWPAQAPEKPRAPARAPSTPPAEKPAHTWPQFALKYGYKKVGEKPEEFGVLIASEGRVYQFVVNNPEVILVDRVAGQVEIIHLRRREVAIVSQRQIDHATNRLREARWASIVATEKKGGKANRVQARIDRNLIDPRFEATTDPAAHAVHLRNASITVDARGEPDPDPVRLALTGHALTTLAKIDWLRNSANLPPYPRLDAIAALVDQHHWRPAELNYLLRLAGPPQRHHWVYHFVPKLTENDLVAVYRVDRVRGEAKRVDFEVFMNRE
jgi:hypothetical protein